MTAREYLEQYKRAYYRAERLQKKLDELRDNYDSVPGGISLSSYSSDISKPTERKVERVQRAFDRWAAAQLDAVEIRQQIFDTISGIDDSKTADLLWYRYLGLFTWEDVCETVGYSWNWVHRKHAEGLRAVDQLINNEN